MAVVPAMSLSGMLMVILLGSGVGIPLGVPPGPPDPMALNIAPPQCLYYATWAGMADPDPASTNNTERLLAEPEVKAFADELQAVMRQVVTHLSERGTDREQVLVSNALPLVQVLVTHPAVFFVESVAPRQDGIDVRGALVVNVGDDLPRVKEALQEIRRQLPPQAFQEVTVADNACVRWQPRGNLPAITIGFRDRYLIVAAGDGSFEGVLDRAHGEPPAWLKQAIADLPMPSPPSTLGYVNLEALWSMAAGLGGPRVQGVLDTLGISGVTRIVSVSGLDETGFVNRVRVVTKENGRGLLALTPDKPLTAHDLKHVPRDASIAAALRLDLARLHERGIEMLRELEPAAAEQFDRMLAQVEEELDISVGEGLLQPLGDVWTIHAAPSGGGLLAGWTLAASVRDKARLEATHQKLLQFVQTQFAQMSADQPPRIRTCEYGEFTIYTLDVPDDDFVVAPSWCLTDSHLVVALVPQAIKSFLRQRDAEDSLADQPTLAKLLAGDEGLCAISYQDTRDHFLTFYPWLQYGAQMASKQLALEGLDVNAAALPSSAAIAPHLLPTIGVVRKTADGFEFVSHGTLPSMNVGASAPVLVGLLLPAVQSAREAARRSQSMNNLKWIGLAMHNYHDVFRGFPAAYSVDKDGKPLLSWRVHILPFIEQQTLYDQFHLDEPWDSEHNRTLIDKMPETYASPNSIAGPGKTIYLGVAGKDGVFAPPKQTDSDPPPGPYGGRAVGVSLRNIVDGTSNTIMVVEAGQAAAVTWTKPDDFVPPADDPIRGLVGTRPGGFLAALCDGSVRFISETIDKETLKALFTIGGGEVVADY